MEEIKKYNFLGIVESERFYSEDTSFGVYSVKINDEEIKNLPSDAVVYNHTTITGNMQKLLVGCEYQFSNMLFSYNKKYDSYQMTTGVITSKIPECLDEQELFLNLITTPTRAETLLKVYPNIVSDVINNKEDIDFKKTKGIKEKTWKKIRDNILNHYILSGIMMMLQPLGVTFTAVKRLLEGEESPALLKNKLENNPYILTKIHGFGFKRVDGIALKLKPELIDSEYRLTSFLFDFFIGLGENSGDTYIKEDDLRKEIKAVVPECYHLYNDNIDSLSNILYRTNGLVGLRRYYNCETEIFNILEELQENHKDWPIKIDEAIKLSEKEQGFNYNEDQLETIKNSLNSSVSVITGKAGTGKSTIIRAIMKAYKRSGYVVTGCALSAKAASRIMEVTGVRAHTIHRLLGWNGRTFVHDNLNPLNSDVLMIDEASMIGAELFLSLLRAVEYGKRVVIIGDNNQLPPIGFGNVFNDLLSIKDFYINKLSKVMRQAEKSGILMDANTIRKSKSPIKIPCDMEWRGELKDMCYMFLENQTIIRDYAVKLYLKAVKELGTDDVVILVPKRKECMNSADELSNYILDKLIPNENNKLKEIVIGKNKFRVGAKVMQIKNDYDKMIFNGDMGYITKIWEELDEDNPKQKTTMIRIKFNIMDDFIDVDYSKSEMNEVQLAYAMTVHKFQGSSNHTVIGICDNSHMFMLDSCLMYTMITRAKERCVLLTQEKAFKKGVHTNKSIARKTWLSLKN